MLGPFVLIVPILSIGIFVFCFALMFSTKLRGKFMGMQAKSLKHMMDGSKDVFKDLGTTMGEISVSTKKAILDNNESDLKHIVDKEVSINKDAVKVMAGAIKEGFSKEIVFCKHCGSQIDKDSKFCKACGKEQ